MLREFLIVIQVVLNGFRVVFIQQLDSKLNNSKKDLSDWPQIFR